MAEYTGPVCFVGQDHEAADGRTLEGGWHYTVVQALTPDGEEIPHAEGESPHTMAGEKLFHDPETDKYRLAKDSDESHAERFPGGLKLIAVDGGLGDVRTPEEFDAAHRHLDELEQRLKDEGVHEQESDHILTTQQEIDVMRGWLTKAQS